MVDIIKIVPIPIQYGSNSGESAKKEVKVRRKDKVSERTIKSKSEVRRKSES